MKRSSHQAPPPTSPVDGSGPKENTSPASPKGLTYPMGPDAAPLTPDGVSTVDCLSCVILRHWIQPKSVSKISDVATDSTCS